MILYHSKLESSPDGFGDLAGLVQANWSAIENMFSKTNGLTASQATTTITASDDVFVPDDAGATIRFADGTLRVINTYTSPTVVEATVSGTVTAQSFHIFRTDQVAADAFMRGLLKVERTTAAHDGAMFYWNSTLKRLVPVSILLVDDAGEEIQVGIAPEILMGFWGATPIVQPAHVNQAAIPTVPDLTGSDTIDQAALETYLGQIQTLANRIRTDLIASGLIKGEEASS